MNNVTYASVTDAISSRFGVLTTRGSAARVVGWTVAFAMVLSQLLAPAAPSYLDRDVVADDPPSAVRYVAPINQNDVAGFLAPPGRPDEFNLAWIGGSEIKLAGVSVPGEFSQQVTDVGGRPVVIDAYSIIGMRLLDTYRAALAAIDNDADAIVIALNPTFITDEWALTEWRNLDISDGESLLADPRTIGWFLALISPGDVAQRLGTERLPLLRSQADVNRRQQSWFDVLDVLHEPSDPEPVGGDPRLPADSTSFWLHQELPHLGDTVVDRVAGIVRGFGIGGSASSSIMDALLTAAGDADIPVYLYADALDPDFIKDPEFVDIGDKIESVWTALGARNDHTNVIVQATMLSKEFSAEVPYLDPIHTADAEPLATLLVSRLCAQWTSFDATLVCASP